MSTVPVIDQQAVKLGFRSRLAFGEEAAFGERAAPTRSFEFRAGETLRHDRARLESEELRGTELQPGWGEGSVGVGGDLTFELKNRGMGLLLKHAFGAVDTTEVELGEVYDHTFTFGDLTDLSLTAQIVRDDIPFDYTGLKINELGLSCQVDQFALLRCGLLGRAELLDQDPHVSAFPDVARMTFIHGDLQIEGEQVPVNSFQSTLANGLNENRRRIGSPYRRNPQRDAYRNFTAELNADFADLALYNRFISGEHALLELIFAGGPIPGAPTHNYGLALSATVRFDGTTPTVQSPGEIRQELTVKAFPSVEIEQGVELVYTTDDATP